MIRNRIAVLACLAEPGSKRRNRPALGFTVVSFLICGVGLLNAQDIPLTPSPRNGFHIYSLSANSVYYSNGLSEGSGLQPGLINTSSDLGWGGSARLGWLKTGERSNITLNYVPSYTGRVRYSAWNSLNQSLFFSANRKFARKWNFGFSAAGTLGNREDILFSPTVYSNLATLPTTFDNLASAMQTGRITDPQLASALTGSLLVETPGRNILYGQRMLTSGAQTSLSYFWSPRFSVNFNASGSRNQNISTNQSSGQNNYLVGKTTSGGATVSVSYSISPKTQLGAAMSGNRLISPYQDIYTTSSVGSLGRTIGRRWLVQVHGGVAFIRPIKQTIILATGPQPTYGGNLIFKTFSNSFLGGYDRVVSDSYGLGAGSTSNANAAWRWKRPGNGWSFDAGLSRQQLQGNGFGGATSWRGTAGLGRALGSRLSLLTQYTYLRNAGQVGILYTFSQSAMRLSLVWNVEPELVQ